MNIFKKIVSFIIIISLLTVTTNTFAISYNQDNDYDSVKINLIDNLNSSSIKLLEMRNGKKYVAQLSTFLEKLNEKNSLKLQKKLDKINKKLESKNDSKSEKLKIIIKYIEDFINLKLYLISKNKENIKENISPEDKEKIEKEIMILQLNLLSSTNNFLKNITKEFEKLSKYEEKGNLKMSLDIDYEEIGEVDSSLELQNYKIKNNLLDTSFETDINVSINSKLKKDIEKKLNLNSEIGYIQKNGLEYILINKLKIVDQEGFNDLKEYIETAKKIAEENKYIEIGNELNQDIIKIIKNINPKKILDDSNKILSKPFFEAYNKTDNKYYLKPTKYGCDKIKEIANKFDPINGNSCSESQYNDLLKEITKYGNLYIEIDNDKKIVYKYKKTSKLDSGIISITFDEKNIKNIFTKIVPNQSKYKNEGFSFEYNSNQNINFNLNAEKGKISVDFKSKLNKLNLFTNIDLKAKIKENRDDFSLNYKLDNNEITGDINFISSSYNWETREYKQSNILDINLDGTKGNWKLKAINKNIETQKETFNSSISFKNKTINGKTVINDKEGNNFLTISHKGKIDIKYFELNNKIILNEEITKGLLNSKEKSRDSSRIWDLKRIQMGLEQYYADYSEYPTTINDNKELQMYLYGTPKDPLGNIEMDGCKFGYIYEIGDENKIENQIYKLSTCLENDTKIKNDNGTDNKRFEIGNTSKTKFKKRFYINGYKKWTKQEKNTKTGIIEENINIKINTNNNRNYINFLFNILLNSNEIIKFEFINDSKRTYKEVKIEKPTNSIKLEDFINKK